MSSPAHLEKLLVCTDESPDSQGAVTAALNLAKAAGCKVYLLQVLTFVPLYELQAPDLLPPPTVNLEMQAAQEAAVRSRLEVWKAKAAELGVDLEPRLRTSASAYDGILEEVEEVKPDWIIMGRHGLTGLARLLMGSVTARVIGHSPVNVLVVPQGAPLEFKRLLMPRDDSPFSAAAWEEALSISQRMGSHLIGMAVAATDGEVETAKAVVQKMEADAKMRGVALETAVPQGRPDQAIIMFAQAKKVNLIVMGSHGRTGWRKLLMGSVVERVIGQAPCPVLVVKKK
ncbi:MAG: universal stress protein [Deltaproteobacteria bacterium]|nr:universal stress protein [Deltaproteobacteria bacterium]